VNLTISQWALIGTSLHIVLGMIVDSLDAPTPADSRRYRFWYKFLNQVALNLRTASDAGKPFYTPPGIDPGLAEYIDTNRKKLQPPSNP
jgi:hypothetical protein